MNKTTALWQNPIYRCHDLPTLPDPEVGKILVTGATGYIGGRLVPELLARGYQVRVMVRAESPEIYEQWPDADVVVADALNRDSLYLALEGISVAYYLIHSLLMGPKDFAASEISAAKNFRIVAESKNLKRIVYLGGLGDIHRGGLSPHLQSRIMVARELQKGLVPVTILRAAIIIGSGSASYEIILGLVKKLHFLPVPRWAETQCQPIAIRDVIKYLVGVLEVNDTVNCSFDIGGTDVVSYKQMIIILADLLNRRMILIPFFYSNIKLYSYLASLITPVPAAITLALMEGLRNEVCCGHDAISRFLPIKRLGYREAIVLAMTREEQDNIYTRWSNAYPPAHELSLKLSEIKDAPTCTTRYSLSTEKSAASLFQSISMIGGKDGWFANNWMWRLRGVIDRLLMGVGTSRGRRSYLRIYVNDVIGFWRIEDLQLNMRLLLRAEMKLPGKAWLEFKIEEEGSKGILSVTPYYHTHTLAGKIYWFIFLPFHEILFNDLIKQIEVRSH
ncbi:SDR family oxidoreductase [candidate division KSB1 bacterium]|nr:SDR family oxidoreductase [candidate division KSB1 bacterium]